MLTLRKNDQFAGKSTAIAFETEQRPYAGPVARCHPAIAVLIRAKVDGEVLNGFTSEDMSLTIAQHALRERPSAASTPAPPAMPTEEALPAEPEADAPVDYNLDPDADERDPGENGSETVLEPIDPYVPDNVM